MIQRKADKWGVDNDSQIEKRIMDKDEIISAFAFKTGKLIEELIKEQTDNLQERNQMLEAKILQWYAKSKDESFADHFGITPMRSGNAL